MISLSLLSSADSFRLGDVLSSSSAGQTRNRGNPGSMTGSNHRRQHVIERVYGPGNAVTRKNIAEVEERMERSRTGLINPDHVIEYENHPFEQQAIHSRRGDQRFLQSSTTGDTSSSSSSAVFKPLRIYFSTDALDNMRDASNAAKIDFIKREILPRTADFWQTALSVVPVSGNLLISTSELDNRAYCGDSEFTEVPTEHITDGVPDVDLVLYVSGTPSTRFCSGTTLAVAVACNFDQYDRPTAGSVVRITAIPSSQRRKEKQSRPEL
jgi:hypothetical protein